ncbi:Uncharacterised protein [Streptococcus pneumoniae]|nr:Uncharacterised protein [Streptococcus pneumoniae]
MVVSQGDVPPSLLRSISHPKLLINCSICTLNFFFFSFNPIHIFSSIVICGKMSGSCGIKYIPFRCASDGFENCCFLPFTYISPSSYEYNPVNIFINVDFPAPFPPTKAYISPRSTCKFTSFNTS